VAAICDQAAKYIHTCFHVAMYEPYVALAARLNELAPGDSPKMTMFANSGAEAVENAVKVARYDQGRPAVICFENAFHGRTLLGMSLTSKVKPYKLGFGPFAPEIYRIPFAYCYRCPFGARARDCDLECASHLEDFLVNHTAAETTAALIAEPVLGEGGYIVPPPEYFPRLKRILDRHGILLIADEIQTGLGRTGAMFAMEHWKVEADITTIAKSLAAGMPLSAVTGKAEIIHALFDTEPFIHISTFGGAEPGAAAALAVLDIVESPGFLEHVNELERRFAAGLDGLPFTLRHLGLMMAFAFPVPEAGMFAAKLLFDAGIFAVYANNDTSVLQFLPPLTSTDGEADEIIDIVRSVFG